MALDSPRNANGMHHNHKYHSFCLRSDTMLRQCNGTAISQLSNMHMPEVLQWNTSQDLWHMHITELRYCRTVALTEHRDRKSVV